MIRVSVVTIVLNQKELIQRCIDSVIHQTYNSIEYIIIDGGSTDGTLDILKKNENHISYWVSEKDKGISDAFNKGIKQCSGELIGIINADDWYEEDAIEKVVNQYMRGDIFYGNVQFWNKSKKAHLSTADHKMLTVEMTLNHPAVFVKKALYDLHGTFNTTYRCAMDYELLLRMYCKKAQFVYVDELLANMQMEGLSHQKWKLGYREVRKAKDNYLGKPFVNRLWYYKQVFTIYTYQTLASIGLRKLVELYRAKLAPVKKTIEK